MGVMKPTSFSQYSRRRDYDLNQDALFDYAGTHHVRVLKRFESPNDHPSRSIEAKLIAPEYNRIFHLRFYIPKAALISKEQSIRDVVIMFNGLNEIDRFDLYDILGQHLAEQGIAAVLLPTPYHLNRSGLPPGGPWPELPHAKLFRHPMLMYHNYKQSMLDSDLLIQKLRGEVPGEDFGFYKTLFGPGLRISILGFSLGGLRALASFVHEPKKYHTCIVFNSGVELSLLNTEFIGISKTEWKEFVRDLVRKAFANKTQLSADSYWEYFNEVYLGSSREWLKGRLQEVSQQLLFILSGGDPIVPPDVNPIELEGHGLTVLKIAGVGHIPTMDPKWSPWMNRVSEFIIRFVSHTGRNVWSDKDIISEVGSVLAGSNYTQTVAGASADFGTTELQNLLKDLSEEKRQTLLRLFYASMAYYPSFREVLDELGKKGNGSRKSAKSPQPGG